MGVVLGRRGEVMAEDSDKDRASDPAPRQRDPDEARLAERLARLSKRLSGGDADTSKTSPPVTSDVTGLGRALRVATDLAGGVLVGVAIGLLLDRLLSSTPWGLLIFVLLGFCAGVLNMLRGVGLLSQPGEKPKDRRSDRQ